MPQRSMIPNRDQAGSLTLPSPIKQPTSAAATAKSEVLQCGGNVLLMEARLCEVTSSIRALVRSNGDLEEALRDAPNDPDFLQAVEENRMAIFRQGKIASSLVDEMKAKGSHVDLEPDIEGAMSALFSEVGRQPQPPQEPLVQSANNDNTAPQQTTPNENSETSGGLFL